MTQIYPVAMEGSTCHLLFPENIRTRILKVRLAMEISGQRISKDPVSGQLGRHHVSEYFFANEFKRLAGTDITKNAVPHTL